MKKWFLMKQEGKQTHDMMADQIQPEKNFLNFRTYFYKNYQ